MTDFTTIHPLCASMAHHLDFHLWRGAPVNSDAERPVQILVNAGYAVGFSPTTLQPAWSAYTVAQADQAVDYKRPLHYYTDVRLDPEHRLSKRTFGKLGDIPLNVGHMAPNEVINRQFGRLAQSETFLMSNMSPQYESLNQGVWAKLEDAIRGVQSEPGIGHAWVIVGPVFGDDPPHVSRDGGKLVPVPEAYFALVVDPKNYPYDTPGSVDLDCFLIPQTAPRSSDPDAYPSTREEIERRTGFRFFDSWGRTYSLGQEQNSAAAAPPRTPSRLMQAIESKRAAWAQRFTPPPAAQPVGSTIGELIADLKTEAERTSEWVRGEARQTRPEEKARAEALQHTLSWLTRAQEIAQGSVSDERGRHSSFVSASETSEQPQQGGAAAIPATVPAQTSTNIITYKIAEDVGDRLKRGARAACNFWNRFIVPNYSVVIRLGTFTELSGTIARAYEPYDKAAVRYGMVEFNTRFLLDYSPDEIAGTIIHEIGHTLGIGWDDWNKLYDGKNGLFGKDAVGRFAALADMEVELDGGDGTALAHWDEERFDRELMTGYKDRGGEHVLPITIAIMAAFGHEVINQLDEKTSLEELLQGSATIVFTRQDEARQIDLEHFVPTPLSRSFLFSIRTECVCCRYCRL